jgi:hypothetical protein
MSQPKVGDVVLYRSLGRTVNALVMSSRLGEVSHLGKDGEPLLTLAVLKQLPPNAPHKRPTVLQASVAEPEIEIVRDVVHVSHEFSPEFKRDKGLQTPAQIASQRGPGEWFGLDEVPAEAPVTDEVITGQPRDETPAEEKARESAELAEERAEDVQPRQSRKRA